MAILTLFTCPKPFADPVIARLQRNALRSWKALGPEVDLLVVGDEAGAQETATELGIRFLPDVSRNVHGTPLIRSIFAVARQSSPAPLMAYANADVIFLPDLVESARLTAGALETFLLVGQRWDIRIDEALAFDREEEARLRARLKTHGRLHPPSGSDYFVFPRGLFDNIPDLAVGRAGWDNWMLFEARRRRWPVVDATTQVTAIHQEHDYRHLPGGKPHYRMPESEENLRLAGGRRAILTLSDADWELKESGPARRSWTARRWARELELMPLLRWGSRSMAHVSHALFHPVKAWGEVRGWLAYKLGPLSRAGR